MSGLPPLITRNYNPETDVARVQDNLKVSGHYVGWQDGPDRIASMVSRLPSAVLVVAAENPDIHGHEVYGNAFAPDCSWPLFGRVSLCESITEATDRFEIARVLYNGVFRELLARGAEYAEELVDIPAQDVTGHRQKFLEGFGFTGAWHMRSMVRPLKDEHGRLLPEIPPLALLGDTRSLEVL